MDIQDIGQVSVGRGGAGTQATMISETQLARARHRSVPHTPKCTSPLGIGFSCFLFFSFVCVCACVFMRVSMCVGACAHG